MENVEKKTYYSVCARDIESVYSVFKTDFGSREAAERWALKTQSGDECSLSEIVITFGDEIKTESKDLGKIDCYWSIRDELLKLMKSKQDKIDWHELDIQTNKTIEEKLAKIEPKEIVKPYERIMYSVCYQDIENTYGTYQKDFGSREAAEKWALEFQGGYNPTLYEIKIIFDNEIKIESKELGEIEGYYSQKNKTLK